MRDFSIRIALKTLLFACLMLLPSMPAQAGLTITEKLVLIEGRARFADVTLVNTSDRAESYEMFWRFFEQQEGTGRYKTADASPTEFDLSKHIVFTPRRITIPPRTSQKVRLALRLKGQTLAPGDYRVHLEFREIPDADPLQTQDPTKPTVGIKVNVGFSIPVVYRVGEGISTVSMGNVTTRLNPDNGRIEVVVPITRQGAYSILGNLLVYYRPQGGEEKLVGQISNANIFSEITTRILPVTLNTNDLRNGTLRVLLKDEDEAKNIVLAEKIIPIGQ